MKFSRPLLLSVFSGALVCLSFLQVPLTHVETECNPTFSTVYSPNGDGINDCIAPHDAACVESVKCSFYNRWGQVVYETTDPHFCWNTKDKNGNPVEAGVYYYVYEGKLNTGKKVKLDGNISVLR